ncbi:MAG: alcohol dehydrogenase catalytic domain-containing protein [Clostridiales Family XIII bacterium]|nr:alcohol dehydrogenase catalytic domain-containing protein [Clostridiales Family XIII bacterium]
MKSVYVQDIHKVEVHDDTPIREPEGDEILMRVEYAGICGSDLHLYNGVHPFRKPPIIVGHEMSGVVAKTGPEATQYKEGDRVTAMPMQSCLECDACGRGLGWFCKERKLPGMDGWPGSFVAFWYIREPFVFKLPDELDTKTAVLAEPATIAYHSLDRVPPENRKNLLIMGAGAIGTLSILVAKAMGFEKIITTDVVQYNLDRSPEFGADAAIQVKDGYEGLDAAVDEIFGEARATAIYVTAGGDMDILQKACRYCGVRSTIVVIPPIVSPPATVILNDLVAKEISVVGAVNYGLKDFAATLDIIARRKEAFQKVITHCFELDAAQEAFDFAARGKEGHFKVAIRFPEQD